MPMTIIIEEETGVRGGQPEIDDPSNLLICLVTRAAEEKKRLRVLSYVDPYGNTILNALQQDAALADLDELDSLAQSPEESLILDKLKSLLTLSRRAPHQYVRFMGD
jgi:hypothetical protein